MRSFKTGTWALVYDSLTGCTGMRAEFSVEKVRRGIFMGESRGNLSIRNFCLPSAKCLSFRPFFYIMERAHWCEMRLWQ